MQAALGPVCFLIGKQHFREFNWRQGSAKTCGVQEYPLFPGPACVEVGLSEEGVLWEGRGKGHFEEQMLRLPVLGRKAAVLRVRQSHRQSAALERDKQNTETLSPVLKCRRPALSVCAGC